MPDNSVIDKTQLYGRYQAGEDAKAQRVDWRDQLGKKLAHKSLDIPEDADEDMQINAPKTTINGIGTKGVVGAVLAATALPTALAGGIFWNNSKPTSMPTTPAPMVAPANPAKPAPLPQVQDIEQVQQPDGSWKEIWRGPPRPKVSADKVDQ